MGPEPTLLIAVDGEIEHAEGRESRRVEESIPPDNPNPQLPDFLNCSFSHYFPSSLIHTFMHSSIFLSITSLTHSFPLLPELFP